MKQINVALIGLGNMGRNHLRVLQDSPHFAVKAVVEPHRPPENSSNEGSVRYLSSVEDLDPQQLDAVVVATPTQTHYQLAKTLMEQRLHVLVEKPAASTFQQAEDLNHIAKKSGVYLAVGNIERCNPVIPKLKELLQTGTIGVPVHVNAIRGGGFPAEVKPGNNVILDLAVHDLDALQLLLGSLRVTGAVSHSTVLAGICDTAEITVESHQGITGSVHVNWLSPQKIRQIRVTGTKGVCVVDYIQQSCEVFGKELDLSHQPGSSQLDHPFCQHWTIDVPKGEPLKIQLEQWRRCLAGEDHGLAVQQELSQSVYMAEQAMAKAQGGLEPHFFMGEAWLEKAQLPMPQTHLRN